MCTKEAASWHEMHSMSYELREVDAVDDYFFMWTKVGEVDGREVAPLRSTYRNRGMRVVPAP